MKNKIILVAELLAVMFVMTGMAVAVNEFPTANISGIKFNDVNNNGIKDPGEPGLADWTITLTTLGQEFPITTLTDSKGNYIFTGLAPGNYTVGEVLQAGWTQTAPIGGTYTVNLTNGDVTGKDFGNLAQLGNGTVMPGQGVDFQQVSFMPPAPDIPNSDFGQVSIDPGVLIESIGISGGYLNIFTDAGWVMQNLRVNQSDAVGPFVSYFSLGIIAPTKVSVLSAHIEFTLRPQQMFTDGPRSNFSVGAIVWNAAGVGLVNKTPYIESVASRYPISASAGNLVVSGDPDTWYTLPNDVNVETAQNQCFPMAIANSLQYLKLQFGINVLHEHKLGLKGDNTLVGQLDTEADRTVTDRRNGGGVWFTPMLEGKFSYLNKTGLKDKLIIEHQGRGWGNPPNEALPDGDFTSSGITSKDEGNKVTFNFICDQIKKGEDVELVWRWDTDGGHAVRVFECGTTAGIQRIGYLSDNDQGDDNAGIVKVREEVKDFDNDGTLDIGSQDRPIMFVMSESPVSAPAKGSISGMKFNDLNGNGTRQSGEPGLANWTIKLTNDTGVTIIQITAPDGSYNFTNLTDGNYTIGEVIKPGWIQKAPAVSATGSATYKVQISGGNAVIGKDFGNMPVPPRVPVPATSTTGVVILSGMLMVTTILVLRRTAK